MDYTSITNYTAINGKICTIWLITDDSISYNHILNHIQNHRYPISSVYIVSLYPLDIPSTDIVYIPYEYVSIQSSQIKNILDKTNGKAVLRIAGSNGEELMISESDYRRLCITICNLYSYEYCVFIENDLDILDFTSPRIIDGSMKPKLGSGWIETDLDMDTSKKLSCIQYNYGSILNKFQSLSFKIVSSIDWKNITFCVCSSLSDEININGTSFLQGEIISTNKSILNDNYIIIHIPSLSGYNVTSSFSEFLSIMNKKGKRIVKLSSVIVV